MKIKIWTKRKIKRFRESIDKKVIFEWGVIAVLLFIAYFMFNYLLMPQINLIGGKHIVINYKDNYSDMGYSAKYLGKDVTSDVKVSGNVNSKKLGKYKIVYQVKGDVLTKKVVRVVDVLDKEKHNIDIDKTDVYVCPGSEVVPEKVKASDNYDGDISSKVKFNIEKDKITYYVLDSNGNKKSISKKIIYKDNVAPNLALKDSDYMYLYVGDSFNDPLYEVSDNCDDKVKVNVSGSVDTSKTGDYKLVYKAVDKAGNKSEAVRHVIISERNKNGTIYLTFDDGPQEGTTNVILDILKEEGVKATFFVTNKGPDYLLKREYDEGHSIGLHTSSHDYSRVYASVDAYFNDLYSVQERVKNVTGYESHIIRFPGGSSNTISRKYCPGIMSSLTKDVINKGFKYYDWNLSSGDAAGGRPTAEDIKNNVINNLRKDRANMILMHDIKTYTRDALRDIIKYAKENGYRFEVVTMDTDMVQQRVNN